MDVFRAVKINVKYDRYPPLDDIPGPFLRSFILVRRMVHQIIFSFRENPLANINYIHYIFLYVIMRVWNDCIAFNIIQVLIQLL